MLPVNEEQYVFLMKAQLWNIIFQSLDIISIFFNLIWNVMEYLIQNN